MSYKSDLKDAEAQQVLFGHIAREYESGLYVFMDDGFNKLISFKTFAEAVNFRINYSNYQKK